MNIQFKVRPFEQIIEWPGEAKWSRVVGKIVAQGFVLEVDGACYELPTVHVSVDRRGKYALIREAELPLQHGFLLRIDEEPRDEDDPPGTAPGCKISLLKPDESQRYTALLEKPGCDPSSVNLLVPPRFALRVYLDSEGYVDGTGASGCLPSDFSESAYGPN